MDDKSNAFDQMAAALNGHQITDDEGQISEETTSVDSTADQEENTVEETAIPEKGAEPEESTPVEDEGTENELAADETGKRYVPESRFKEIYAEKKKLERELEQSKKAQPKAVLPNVQSEDSLPLQPTDRTEALEVELLKTTLPQFNPESVEYDKTLDEMGAEIYRANPGMTRLAAAKKALKRANELTKTSAAIKAEARQVKTIQADQGITGRVKSTGETKSVDPNSMTLDEKEEWLKANGQW